MSNEMDLLTIKYTAKLKNDKIEWTNSVIIDQYGYYLIRKKKWDINDIKRFEMLLALIQNDILNNGEPPILVFKTYISNGTIYHKYLSDIIRIRKPEFKMPYIQLIDQNILDNYIDLSNDELEKLFKYKLDNKMFDTNYYVIDEYKGPSLKGIARFTADNSGYKYLIMFNYFVIMPILMSLMILSGFIFYWFNIFNLDFNFLINRLISLLQILSIFGFIGVITLYLILKKMKKRSEYEIFFNEMGDK